MPFSFGIFSRLFDLNPNRMDAAVGQRGSELPDSRTHSCPLGVQVENPLAVGQSEPVARVRRVFWCLVITIRFSVPIIGLVVRARRIVSSGVNRHAMRRWAGVIDHLQTMDACQQRRPTTATAEFDGNCAPHFERAQRNGEVASRGIRPAKR